jgi:hypothetical protein
VEKSWTLAKQHSDRVENTTNTTLQTSEEDHVPGSRLFELLSKEPSSRISRETAVTFLDSLHRNINGNGQEQMVFENYTRFECIFQDVERQVNSLLAAQSDELSRLQSTNDELSKNEKILDVILSDFF